MCELPADDDSKSSTTEERQKYRQDTQTSKIIYEMAFCKALQRTTPLLWRAMFDGWFCSDHCPDHLPWDPNNIREEEKCRCKRQDEHRKRQAHAIRAPRVQQSSRCFK